jgi:D-inositol-3-phosphate glycosyltransferase
VAGALFFEGEIRDREEQKTTQKNTRILGFEVFLSNFAKALLAHSRREAVYLTSEAAALSLHRSPPDWLTRYRDRLRVISAYDLSPLKQHEKMILLSVGPEMIHFAWIRSHLNRHMWPIVAITHSLSPPPLVRYFFTNVLFKRLSAYDALVCSSVAAQQVVRKVFESIPEELRLTDTIPFQLPVIPLGIQTDDFAGRDKYSARQQLGIPRDKVVLLYFGRFSHVDKCDLLPLLLAFAKLPNRKSATMILAGDDTQFHMKAGLQEAARQLGCGEALRVVSDPSKEEKLLLLSAADVFVSPSDNVQESFGITIAEAMAAGLPVVASDWNGYKELIADGQTGFLVPTYLPPLSQPLEIIHFYSGWTHEKLLGFTTSVDIDAMVNSLSLLIENPEQRAAMGARARKEARRFDWKSVIAQYDDLWDALLEQSAKSKQPRGCFRTSSFQDVFGHYPTGPWDDTDSIYLGTATDCWPAILDVISTGLRFEKQLFQDILTVIGAKQPLSLTDLITAMCRADSSRELLIRLHIGRLLKYGLIRITKQRPSV